MSTHRKVEQPVSLPYATEYHAPIMVNEILQGLHVDHGWYVDATVGGGGHTQSILEAGGNVIAIDQDQNALDEVKYRLSAHLQSGRLQLIKGNFRDLKQLIPDQYLGEISGILMDLGVSSYQLDQADRGFSFKSQNLDMRMDGQTESVSAAQLVNTLAVTDMTMLFRDLGQERFAKHFAQVIDTHRQQKPLASGQELADMIYQASPHAYKFGPIHPATRVFQALRMAVNDELGSLTMVLPQVVDLLTNDGRLAVLSFHSLEDRIVKHFIQNNPQLTALTKKPVQATESEQSANPRSRSAKLRIATKHISS